MTATLAEGTTALPECPSLPANVRNRREAAALSLAAGQSVAAAARAVGKNERTLRRWLAEPAFLECVQEARRQLFELTLAKLAAGGAEAVDTLLVLMRDGPPAVRLAAARTILESTNRWREAVELGTELVELRQQVEGLRHGHQGPAPGASPYHGNGAGYRP
jgi:hypothetical protein